MKNITKNNSMLHRMIALVMAVVMTLTLVAIDSHFHLFADEAEVAANEVDTIDVTNVLKGYSDGHEATVEYASNKSKAKFSVNKSDIADIKLTAKVGDEDITVEGKDIDVNDIKYLTYKENATDDKDKLNKNPATPTDADKTSALSENVALTTDGDKNTCVALYYAYKKDNAVVKYIYMGTAKVLYDDVAPSAQIQKINLNDNAKNPDGKDYILVNDDGVVNVKLTTSDGKSGSGIERIVYIKDGGEEIELEKDEFNFVAEKGDTSGSGTYVFKAYDKAGNVSEASAPVIIKRVVNGPSIKSITPALVKKNGVDFRLPTFNQANSGYEFTVEVNDAKAGEGNGAVSIESDVCYYIAGDSAHTQVVHKDKAGKYVFYVSGELLKKDDDGHPARIVIYAKDNVFGNKSVGEDQNGDIVFTGGSKPVITVSAGDPDWTKNWINSEHSFDVEASSNSAYIDSVSCSVDGENGNVITDGKAFTCKESVSVDGDARTSLNGNRILLTDGKHEITFTAKDYADETASAKVTVKIDKTAPVVEIKDYNKSDNFNTATKTDQACFNISYSDATSGIDSVSAILRKKVITTDPKTGETTETFTDIEKYSTDATDDNYKLTVDGVNKEIQIPGLDKPDDASGTYSLTLVATDIAGNTCKEVTRELYVNLSDITVSKFALNVDSKTVDLTADNIKDAMIINGDIWTSGKALSIDAGVKSFDLDVEDVKIEVKYRPLDNLNAKAVVTEQKAESVDGEGVVKATYVIPKEGRYEIALRAKIHGTNEFKELKSAVVIYDKTAPGTLSIRCENAFSVSSKGVAYYADKNDVEINIGAKDGNLYNKLITYVIKDENGNEIASGRVSSGNGEYTTNVRGTNMSIKANKVYKVMLTVNDAAKNKSTSVETVSFVVDNIKPEVSVKEVAEYNTDLVELNWSATTDKFGLYKYQVTYDYIAYEFDENNIAKVKDGSKKSVEYDDEKWADYKGSMSFAEDGQYSDVTVYVMDRAGNIAESQRMNFVIDKSDPRIKLSGTSETYHNKSNKITCTLTDDYGIDGDSIEFDVYYKTYDKLSENVVLDNDGVNIRSSLDDRKYVISYTMKQKDRKATKYYFVMRAKDKAGRNVKVTDDSDVITKFNDGYKSKDLIVDSTTPQLVNSYFSLALDDGTVIPYNRSGEYGYFNQNVELRMMISDQFTPTYMTITDKDRSGHNRSESNKKSREFKSKIKYAVADGKDDIFKLEVQAKDGSDNRSDIQKVNFFIDKINPVVEIGNVSNVNNSDVTVPVTITDNMMGSKYKVHVTRTDASGNTSYNADFENGEWSETRFEKNYVFSDEGDYTITVSAEDKAGNKAEEKTTKFRIDKTAPVISISGMNDKQTTGVTATISVDEAFSFNYEDKALGSSDFNVTITKKTDGTAAANVATLGKDNFTDGNPHTATYNCSEDGEYTITAIATDLAGNKAAEQTKTFKVDSKAPVLKVTAVDKDSKKVENYDPIGSMDSSTPNYVDMSLSVEEAFFSTDDVKITVKKDSKDVSSSYFTNYRNSAEISTGTQRFSEDGVYEVAVTAQDELGNKADDYSLVFTVDNTPPELAATNVLDKFKAKTTKTEDGSILLNADDFADIINQGYEALWNVNDTSDFSVDAKIDGVSLIDFSDLTDGYHQLTIEVKDKVGHVSNDEFDFTYDGTAPRIVITGVEDGETVREPFTMTIGLENPDDEITSIVINGNTIDPANYSANNKYEMQVQDYDTYTIEVTAKDKAGNVASTIDEDTGAVFTFKLSEKLSPVVLVIIIIAAILLIALLIFIILASKRKKKNAAA